MDILRSNPKSKGLKGEITVAYEFNKFAIREPLFTDCVMALCTAAERPEVIPALVDIFGAFPEATKDLVAQCINRDLDHTDDEVQILRQDSTELAVLTEFTNRVGKTFLKKILKDTVAPIIKKKEVSFEIDPDRIEGDGDASENERNLISAVKEVCDKFFASAKKLPREIIECALMVFNLCNEKFPGCVRKALGGLLFLRFMCPSLIALGNGDPHATRKFVLMAKVIQSVGNEIVVSEKMSFMNRPRITAFIQMYIEKAAVFFDDVVEVALSDHARHASKNAKSIDHIMLNTNEIIYKWNDRHVEDIAAYVKDVDDMEEFVKEAFTQYRDHHYDEKLEDDGLITTYTDCSRIRRRKSSDVRRWKGLWGELRPADIYPSLAHRRGSTPDISSSVGRTASDGASGFRNVDSYHNPGSVASLHSNLSARGQSGNEDDSMSMCSEQSFDDSEFTGAVRDSWGEVEVMSTTTLIQFLSSMGAKVDSSLFEAEEIDGEAFLELEDSDFKEMGLALGTRRKLLKLLRRLRSGASADMVEIERIHKVVEHRSSAEGEVEGLPPCLDDAGGEDDDESASDDGSITSRSSRVSRKRSKGVVANGRKHSVKKDRKRSVADGGKKKESESTSTKKDRKLSISSPKDVEEEKDGKKKKKKSDRRKSLREGEVEKSSEEAAEEEGDDNKPRKKKDGDGSPSADKEGEEETDETDDTDDKHEKAAKEEKHDIDEGDEKEEDNKAISDVAAKDRETDGVGGDDKKARRRKKKKDKEENDEDNEKEHDDHDDKQKKKKKKNHKSEDETRHKDADETDPPKDNKEGPTTSEDVDNERDEHEKQETDDDDKEDQDAKLADRTTSAESQGGEKGKRRKRKKSLKGAPFTKGKTDDSISTLTSTSGEEATSKAEKEREGEKKHHKKKHQRKAKSDEGQKEATSQGDENADVAHEERRESEQQETTPQPQDKNDDEITEDEGHSATDEAGNVLQIPDQFVLKCIVLNRELTPREVVSPAFITCTEPRFRKVMRHVTKHFPDASHLKYHAVNTAELDSEQREPLVITTSRDVQRMVGNPADKETDPSTGLPLFRVEVVCAQPEEQNVHDKGEN